MINYATKLLKYQCNTATDSSEIDYLKRVGVYEKYIGPDFITEDGYSLWFNYAPKILYSCLKNPKIGEQCLEFKIRNIDDINSKNKERVWFYSKDKCLNYIDLNIPSITKQELVDLKLLYKYIDGKNKANKL